VVSLTRDAREIAHTQGSITPWPDQGGLQGHLWIIASQELTHLLQDHWVIGGSGSNKYVDNAVRSSHMVQYLLFTLHPNLRDVSEFDNLCYDELRLLTWSELKPPL